MRQIKFRAFHPKTQKYLVHDWGIGDGDDGYICNDENGELVYSGDLIWEQFTGLLDSTGKEIYEGDIVMEADNSLNSMSYEIKYCRHAYDDILAFHPINKDDHLNYYYGSWDGKSVKVVGNIFETPELLN